MGKGIDVDRGQKKEAISDPGESETTAPGKSRDTEEEKRTEESQPVVSASTKGDGTEARRGDRVLCGWTEKPPPEALLTARSERLLPFLLPSRHAEARRVMKRVRTKAAADRLTSSWPCQLNSVFEGVTLEDAGGEGLGEVAIGARDEVATKERKKLSGCGGCVGEGR